MYCVVLNPVDAFLNRKAKSGVRKIAVAELGSVYLRNVTVLYYTSYDNPVRIIDSSFQVMSSSCYTYPLRLPQLFLIIHHKSQHLRIPSDTL